jgi:hypothetical protein
VKRLSSAIELQLQNLGSINKGKYVLVSGTIMNISDKDEQTWYPYKYQFKSEKEMDFYLPSDDAPVNGMYEIYKLNLKK